MTQDNPIDKALAMVDAAFVRYSRSLTGSEQAAQDFIRTCELIRNRAEVLKEYPNAVAYNDSIGYWMILERDDEASPVITYQHASEYDAWQAAAGDLIQGKK
jgi:hypothetical protein